jgi:drug/metabolite transporter (DMT)-like permease
MQGKAPSALLVRGSLALLCLIWGSTWLVIKQGLEDMPPLTAAAIRFGLAGLLMIPVARVVAPREGGQRPALRLSLTYGVFALAISYGVIYVVETQLPSGLVSVLWAIYPALLAALAHWMLPSERMNRLQWSGLVLGFGGVALMLSRDLSGFGPSALPLGIALLISPLACAFGNVILKRDGKQTSSILLNRDGMLIGAVLLSAAAWIFERDAEVTFTNAAMLSIGYLTLVGTVFAFGLYYWMQRFVPVTQMSLIVYCIPIIALILGASLDGEQVTGSTLFGMLLILGGVAVVIFGKRRS